MYNLRNLFNHFIFFLRLEVLYAIKYFCKKINNKKYFIQQFQNNLFIISFLVNISH